MIQVHPGLYVGNADDEARVSADPAGWYVISAAKLPWHRDALGYAKVPMAGDPERLIAWRDGRLVLNLIDAPDPAYIPEEIIETALGQITTALQEGLRVLVHCNQGHSRSPTIAMLWLRRCGQMPPDFETALESMAAIYPDFVPGKGMLEYARAHW